MQDTSETGSFLPSGNWLYLGLQWLLLFLIQYVQYPVSLYNFYYTVCHTRYRTRHFFNNFTTNEDIATIATIRRTTDTHYRHIPLHFSHNELHLFKFRCHIFIVVRIIKEIPGSVAKGTHCISNCWTPTCFDPIPGSSSGFYTTKSK